MAIANAYKKQYSISFVYSSYLLGLVTGHVLKIWNSKHREYSNGNHEIAIDCFSRVILDQRTLASFLVKFGMETLDATGNVKYLSKAIELDNNLKHDYRLFERLGISYYNIAKANSEKFSENIEKSIINFQLALGLNPGNPNLSNYLANAKQLNQHEN
ncbi:hypothetical protein H6G54_13735 [Anabaena cylindrica FACHB-243]|uniref:TPR repeat-containing protein n=1 Tax=Anabaena cylindrica (strain ATCC 27899 / PCC 7122) TaxID=272123 RepID=K9ZLD6_ANACC|nr:MULTISPECIES: hypothetical protein [Anabaena]AFZ59599.1 hypothetical protein Anacy_4234 [Anabaena cylindrica PCC 7122]MBD2418737.1 hypothetical protein [Anabaena cylindrica FACHB-243]MBY5281636.1 hypothetical protein [Anabaena sp. CCAP 1446/1C]MBY5309162.1 hypothetical protein [Anabaena sp. CCAP 1446/1C]MCM2406301.1 hypothetical protein [Anabaena sp. CCAP 1446/1C]